MSSPANVGLNRSLLSLQDDKDLVHEFVIAEGLTCLIKVGAEADQNYQNYILRGTILQECWFPPLPMVHCAQKMVK